MSNHILDDKSANADTAQHRLKELEAIYQVSQQLLRLRKPEDLSKDVISVLEEVLNYENCEVLLRDRATDRLYLFALSEPMKSDTFIRVAHEQIKTFKLPPEESIARWVIQNGTSVCIGDVSKDPRSSGYGDEIISLLCVPIKANERTFGVIRVASKKNNAYTEDDIRLLENVAARISVAIQNAQLYNSVIEQRELLRTMAAQLSQVEETQRKQITQELHDRVGQNLSAIHILLDTISSRLPPDLPKTIQIELDETVALLEETVNHVRNIMVELRPTILDDYGLVAALEWLGEQFTIRTGINVLVEDELLAEERLPANIESVFFRISQEALANVSKHAKASQVCFNCAKTAHNTVRLIIADNGVGVQAGEATARSPGSGWGMKIMRERAISIGGNLWVESQSGSGTTLIIEAPYPTNGGAV
jgi:signal transduction histidine kinase